MRLVFQCCHQDNCKMLFILNVFLEKESGGTIQAFLNKEEYGAIVDAADINKLAKMLRILGFLTQTKVYLFWKKDE